MEAQGGFAGRGVQRCSSPNGSRHDGARDADLRSPGHLRYGRFVPPADLAVHTALRQADSRLAPGTRSSPPPCTYTLGHGFIRINIGVITLLV